MSSAPARRPTPSEKDPLSSLAKELPEAQHRKWYAQLISYIHTLEPTDELVTIAQLFGFLTMMGHKLPEASQETRIWRQLPFCRSHNKDAKRTVAVCSPA